MSTKQVIPNPKRIYTQIKKPVGDIGKKVFAGQKSTQTAGLIEAGATSVGCLTAGVPGCGVGYGVGRIYNGYLKQHVDGVLTVISNGITKIVNYPINIAKKTVKKVKF